MSVVRAHEWLKSRTHCELCSHKTPSNKRITGPMMGKIERLFSQDEGKLFVVTSSECYGELLTILRSQITIGQLYPEKRVFHYCIDCGQLHLTGMKSQVTIGEKFTEVRTPEPTNGEALFCGRCTVFGNTVVISRLHMPFEKSTICDYCGEKVEEGFMTPSTWDAYWNVASSKRFGISLLTCSRSCRDGMINKSSLLKEENGLKEYTEGEVDVHRRVWRPCEEHKDYIKGKDMQCDTTCKFDSALSRVEWRNVYSSANIEPTHWSSPDNEDRTNGSESRA